MLAKNRFLLFFIYFPQERKFSIDPLASPCEGQEEMRIERITPDWANARKAFRYTACYSTIAIILSLLVCSWGSNSSRLTLAWTGLLALVALVASMIQFIPQILRTWKLKVQCLV